ncbi:MAG TPA: DUF4249 domain-containing protein [Bacteroidales bacterium]|nr:DUF4249 domain-containing protein [Bacteroidales bacterium]
MNFDFWKYGSVKCKDTAKGMGEQLKTQRQYTFVRRCRICARNSGFIGYLLLLLVFWGCTTMPELDIEAPNDLIVVDGVIEQGRQSRVFVTRNAPYFSSIDSAGLRDLVLSRAKVTLTDGEQSEVLILRRDNRFFPPFYYAGNEIIGEIGKEYTLYVSYGGKSVRAMTSIPEPVDIDSVWFELDAGEDSIGSIQIKFTDPLEAKNYYRIFTMVQGEEDKFNSAFIIAIDDQFFNGKDISFRLYRAPESFLATDESGNFMLGDTVLLKLSTMDEQTFNFWNTYQEEVINATNPFASSMINLESNVEGQGLGVWSGYGASRDTVICQ